MPKGIYNRKKGKNATNYQHGMHNTRFHCIWKQMKQRCLNLNYQQYKYYGNRGIKICKEWLKFINFRDDMYQSYQQHISQYGDKQTTIDRIDNNGNYQPSNCRWATCKEQANNIRNNRLITFNNQTKTIRQWSEYLNINFRTLQNRIYTYKWPINKAFTIPVRTRIINN